MPQPELLVAEAGSHFDDDGNVTDHELRQRIAELVDALRSWSSRIRIREAA